MTDHEKSIELLKMVGWHPVEMGPYHDEGRYRLADENGRWVASEPSSQNPENAWQCAPNLYLSKNMALAWHICNWVDTSGFSEEFSEFWNADGLWKLSASKAQRLFLDKIYELMIRGVDT